MTALDTCPNSNDIHMFHVLGTPGWRWAVIPYQVMQQLVLEMLISLKNGGSMWCRFLQTSVISFILVEIDYLSILSIYLSIYLSIITCERYRSIYHNMWKISIYLSIITCGQFCHTIPFNLLCFLSGYHWGHCQHRASGTTPSTSGTTPSPQAPLLHW